MDRYHHGDLRSALIESGMQMARRKGSGALGMRELTRAVGVSPNAAYRHFPNQRALVLTVAQEARHRLSRSLLDDMTAASEGTDPALRAVAHLRAFGLGYIRFAVTEPGWFALTCESQQAPPDRGLPTGEAPPPSPHQLLVDILDAMARAGLLTAQRRVDAEWVCWSSAHGFALLATSGPLQGMAADAIDRVAARVIDSLIAGLRAPDGEP